MLKVAVVGRCGSGKTTVVEGLRERGFDAYVVGQEHSAVADLWRRRSPDRLVFLDVGLDTVRRRRGEAWPAWLYESQAARLSLARQSADLVVDTGTLSIEETINRIVAGLSLPDESGSGREQA